MSQKTIICLCWHPQDMTVRSAGGFTRFYELLKRCPHPITVIDRYPSLYTDVSNRQVTLVEYHLPPGKIFDRLLTPLIVAWHVLQQAKGQVVLYVPFSELPQLSLAGVMGKYLLSAPLVLVNLNVNVYKIDLLVNALTHRLADRVITISRALQSDLARTGIRAGFVNGVGFTPPTTITRPSKHDGAIYIGRHDPQKGIFDLLRIWSEVLKLLPTDLSPRLTTAGDIPLPYKSQIDKQIADLNLEDRISLLGPVTNAKKLQLLQQAQVCLFPSRHEGWGIVPMEALAVGTSVVVYDLPVYRESIGSTPGLHTVKIGDIATFAKTATRLISKASKPFSWKPLKTWDEIAKTETAIICQD